MIGSASSKILVACGALLVVAGCGSSGSAEITQTQAQAMRLQGTVPSTERKLDNARVIAIGSNGKRYWSYVDAAGRFTVAVKPGASYRLLIANAQAAGPNRVTGHVAVKMPKGKSKWIGVHSGGTMNLGTLSRSGTATGAAKTLHTASNHGAGGESADLEHADDDTETHDADDEHEDDKAEACSDHDDKDDADDTEDDDDIELDVENEPGDRAHDDLENEHDDADDDDEGEKDEPACGSAGGGGGGKGAGGGPPPATNPAPSTNPPAPATNPPTPSTPPPSAPPAAAPGSVAAGGACHVSAQCYGTLACVASKCQTTIR